MTKTQEVYLDSVQRFNEFYGFETLHPLISVVRYDKQQEVEEGLFRYGLYALFLKENKGCTLSYGLTEYDYDEMTVTSFAPGQSVKVESMPGVQFPKWTALVFHPDFLARTPLGRNISRYEFFSYTSNEALHLSTAEIEIFRRVLDMIEQELHHAIDKHSRELMVSNIELLLNYCLRFYDRQFITREELNHSVVKKFKEMLDDYLKTKAETEGLPTVAYFADKCCLSNNYFSELVKVETGNSAKDFINDRLIVAAKELLNDERLNISEVSQRLGFDYPQHFARFFKLHTGKTPSQYRQTA
ncbi:MAG: helix-turn-helix transcriptional regulator [Paludibacteraceae bacterium]|nr:helix-turn-helix transcriptional regulator [Paludibacteraceae bacterium]